jgi:FkbM family methyltransferase
MSRLVAIEAHPATYECLCKNLFGLTTEIHNVALGDGSMVSCAYEPHGTGRSLFVNDSAGSVKSMGLKEMFDAFSIKGPDVLLKVDCEGGERVLLDNPQDAEIINSVASVVMELHLCCPAWPPFNHLPGEERWKEFFNACRHKKKEWRGSTIGNCAMIKLEGL